MHKNQKVAVLMATYNGERYIEAQLVSILYQLQVSIEIFVSDDLSNDRTQYLLHEFAKKNDNIHLVSLKDKFGSAGRNFFNLIKNVDLEGYDFVAFSDQDDIWFPNKLISSIEEMESTNSSGYSSDTIGFWLDKKSVNIIKKSFPQKKFDHWFESPGPGCSQVFSGESFKIFQKFVIDNYSDVIRIDYHDWFAYAFFRNNGFRWLISEHPRMLYVQHGGNQFGANSGLRAIKNRLSLAAIKWHMTQVTMIANLLDQRVDSFLSVTFLFKNVFTLRRRKSHSLALVILYLLVKIKNFKT